MCDGLTVGLAWVVSRHPSQRNAPPADAIFLYHRAHALQGLVAGLLGPGASLEAHHLPGPCRKDAGVGAGL